MQSFRFLILFLLFVTICPIALNAQNIYRPRIALANDGSYAIAWEEFRQLEFTENWQIAVQRYAANGQPLEGVHYFDPPSCSTTDVWLNDDMQHVELLYNANGQLVVVMEHIGAFQFIFSERFTSEITLAVIDVNGAVLDLNNTQSCTQFKFIYVGDTDMARPRFALTDSGELHLVADGNYQDVNFRNSAYNILLPNLNSVYDRPQILHEDRFSQNGFHMWPDVATNGALLATVWHRCPFINSQGDVVECDVDIQFANIQGGTTVTALGTNRVVNSGDPAGTINFRPSVAMAQNGQSVVTWVDNRTGAQFDVFGQRFDAAGQPAGGNFQISESSGFIDIRSGMRPEVAMLDSGRFMVVWGDSSAAGFRSWQRLYTNDGTPLSPPELIASSSTIDTGQPAIATNGSAFLTSYLTEGNNTPTILVSNPPTSRVSNEPERPQPTPELEISSFPQPFRRHATVHYELPDAGYVRIDVYNALGQKVTQLVDAYQTPGSHEVTWQPNALPPGLYMVRINSGSLHAMHTMVYSGP